MAAILSPVAISLTYFLDNAQNEVIGISRSPEKSPSFLPYKRHQEANFKFYQMNLNRDMSQIIELLDSLNPEYVVNFAAQSEVAPSWEHPEQWLQNNVVALAILTNALNEYFPTPSNVDK